MSHKKAQEKMGDKKAQKRKSLNPDSVLFCG